MSGLVSANGVGAAGGSITIANLNTSAALDVTLSGNITATGSTLGSINLNQAGQAVIVTSSAAGIGNLTGITNSTGASVSINPQGTNTTLTTGTISGTAGAVSLIVNTGDTSQIVIPAASTVSSSAGNSVTLTGATISNSGSVTGGQGVAINTNALTNNSTITATTGNITVGANDTAAVQNVTLAAGSNLTATAGNVSFTDAGGITLNGGTSGTTGTISANGTGGTVTFTGGTNPVLVGVKTINGLVGGTGSTFDVTVQASPLNVGGVTCLRRSRLCR